MSETIRCPHCREHQIPAAPEAVPPSLVAAVDAYRTAVHRYIDAILGDRTTNWPRHAAWQLAETELSAALAATAPTEPRPAGEGLIPLAIVDDRTPEQIAADGDTHWSDGRPYVPTEPRPAGEGLTVDEIEKIAEALSDHRNNRPLNPSGLDFWQAPNSLGNLREDIKFVLDAVGFPTPTGASDAADARDARDARDAVVAAEHDVASAAVMDWTTSRGDWGSPELRSAIHRYVDACAALEGAPS